MSFDLNAPIADVRGRFLSSLTIEQDHLSACVVVIAEHIEPNPPGDIGVPVTRQTRMAVPMHVWRAMSPAEIDYVRAFGAMPPHIGGVATVTADPVIASTVFAHHTELEAKANKAIATAAQKMQECANALSFVENMRKQLVLNGHPAQDLTAHEMLAYVIEMLGGFVHVDG